MGEHDVGADRFELRGRIGAGSMGEVYRVFDRQVGTEVAMKTLKALGPNALFRFKREFRELRDLSHPNLIALFELFTTGDEWMFTMELIEGVSFRDWVREDATRLRPALIQLADALTALHAAGKVHRDVKPSNVMVTPEGRVVLLDFGLISDVARSDLTHEGMAVGTPSYMSPEQAADVPVGAPTDWYAVGTMVYEVLTGRRPFVGATHGVLLDKQRIDPHPPSELVPDVPPELDALCMRLLARNPDERPDGRAVLAALGASPSTWTLRIAERATRPDIRESRAAELAVLRQALADSRDHPVTVRIGGRPGAGRTTLIETFAAEILQGGGRAFVVRVDRRELGVPFRGFDMLIDEVTRYLLRAPIEEVLEVLPRDLASMVTMFPTLRRLRAARVPDLEVRPPPDELMVRALGAAKEMFGKMAVARPLAILIDDTHYGHDLGAKAAMRMLTDRDAPHLLLVTSYELGTEQNPVVAAYLGFTGDGRDLILS